ncbi:uncharacterized protein PHACADRAFT_209373 [Phanerochaete carnosa HHB-10118-sp]|uniref:Cytochrome P450 n=1 Tax=Phanerochaete carnosa (strain HHB-10118-sp) TaxID=650164 RepID=K5W9J6_PHACS|nr:uncharacterized protein PHACADRAFT_209373 [Phanerochaete carnosa HHB-10118-sp]EKM55855.1 hypothetical protein PHACADRAFT_209373 [Phanerochaete carnosa HHB-10118-sp]
MIGNSLALLVLSVALFLYLRRRPRSLPPGPRGLPVIGNARDVPKNFEWLTYDRWSREYDSDIIHLRMFGTTVIIINSMKAANELLNKRSSIYSDREHLVMTADLVGWDRDIGFMPYGDKWREHRRLFHQQFRPATVHTYHPKLLEEARKLLPRLLFQLGDFMQPLRTMTASMILGVTYGMELHTDNDPYVILAEKAVHSMAATGNMGSYAVDYLPWLRYLPSWAPGAGFKRQAAEWKELVVEIFERPFVSIKQAMSLGKAPPCILTTMLEELDPKKDNSDRETMICQVTGTAYNAGSDTPVSSLGTFILAMLLYPDVQRRAQKEMDRIMGCDRLPEFEDRGSLPYITAVMKETLRWHPVSPLVSYKLRADDEYGGYHFPAGSIVIGNAWAILHDKKRYLNPEMFDPTRFLRPDGELDNGVPDPVEAAFGFGRRICPGRHFAADLLWITMAHILATLNIQKAISEAGNVVEPSGEYTSGFISHPVPFKASFKPRSPASLDLIGSRSSLK